MSSLWTPGGERRVPRPDAPPSAAPPPSGAGAGGTGGRRGPGDAGDASGDDTPDLTPEEEARMAEAADEIAAVRAQLAAAPPEQVVANHLIGLYELAAIHLGQPTPNLPAARLAIDALGAVLDTCKGRLGEVEATLGAARSQIQMAYVGVAHREPGGDAGTGADS
jgi:hypothetical protein